MTVIAFSSQVSRLYAVILPIEVVESLAVCLLAECNFALDCSNLVLGRVYDRSTSVYPRKKPVRLLPSSNTNLDPQTLDR